MSLYLSDLVFTPASDMDRRAGLLGYVRVTVNDALRLDGITIRAERGGCLSVSYPERSSRSAQRIPLMRPVHARAARLFQAQILDELKKRGIDL